MRVRSVLTVFGMCALLAGSILRCSLPPLPPGPQALATKVRTVGGAFVTVPAGNVDRPALIASLKALDVGAVFIQTSADASGDVVNDRVALAIDLQRALDATVLIGTYQSEAYSGKPMAELLKTDASFTACYPQGPALDPGAPVIDKLRICSQDVSKKIVAALTAASASEHIGCYVTHEPELVDALTAESQAKLAALLHDAAGPCTDAQRPVAISPRLTAATGDPDRAGVLLRETMRDSGVNFVVLRDGVGTLGAGPPQRAAFYYQGLRNALADRQPRMTVIGNVEAFECADPACTRSHPTTVSRYLQQVCAARGRVDFMVTSEYLHDFAGERLVTPALDAAAGADGGEAGVPADLQAILDDVDAAALLRSGYLSWIDSGASCTALDASK